MAKAVSDLLRRVLMVPPKYFSVEYTINPWMGGKVDRALAHKQWDQLKSAIEAEGVQVLTLEQEPNLPDMVFVCNSGLVFENKGEQHHYLKWFQANGFEVVGADYAEFFEGGGDACFSDYKTLWAGFGARSSRKRIRSLGKFEVVKCELTSDRFYHLDTCFAPVGNHAATQEEIKRRLPAAIAVSDQEAEASSATRFNVRKSVIVPPGVSDKTKDALEKLGYKTVEVDMSEFMKSGGAMQCLVLKL
ncbi:hypothetical protein M3Y99_01118400 [Aphelenchoides fujianensis]|nr:hypothetical protein M3Y99_01118400 [Aphelenchoides fujianensis]